MNYLKKRFYYFEDNMLIFQCFYEHGHILNMMIYIITVKTNKKQTRIVQNRKNTKKQYQ